MKFRTQKTKQNKTDKNEDNNRNAKHISADFRLPDVRGEEGSKTEVVYSPRFGGNNRRNIWSLGDRTRKGIFSTIIPCAT